MSETLRIALVGNPNCGKTSLFNHLTGTRQKVANYAGVTVERKVGAFNLPSGRAVRVLDLPGTYSLNATSPDEAITRDVVLGKIADEQDQQAFLCVVDATNLKLHLGLVLEVIEQGKPILLVLNMMDEARRRGMQINTQKLSQRLGIPVVETVAVRNAGIENLMAALEDEKFRTPSAELSDVKLSGSNHEKIDQILKDVVVFVDHEDKRTDFLDKIFLHPVLGLLSLALMMFVVFQAVFAWAAPFMDGIEEFFAWFGEWIGQFISQPLLNSLVVDGVIAGAGSVVVFLPQILILFFFILVLEESGYLPRAAFLLDKLMFKAGLSGRAFIPLLSSFACAVPGIMATRSISDPRDRLVTILVAPLMTCSARLPVYALLIAAFIPEKMVWGFLNLQGLVLFGLYMAGIVSALIVATVLKFFQKDKSQHALLMELPSYRIPDIKSVWIGLLDRAKIFLKRVGGIIFALSILLWFLCTFPQPPEGATLPAIDYSFAGMLGHVMQPIFAPLGFNWQICIALIPAMAAREVVVAALGTVYALSAADDDAVAQGLSHLISQGDLSWTVATGLSLLVWFIYAPHCLATLATVRRETGSWKTVAGMTIYLFGLAYLMAFLTYQIASRYFGL
ncbi:MULTISPECIES: ferrous iron transport protein B [Acinetobacter]|jgi:ferrous iron transport protein B|uniref:Ferrous iron transport protein B n=1 Tax=Acinetobacter bereziniae TaxID=106648 RepID=A0A0A8TSI3_ACIBZ|nr:MULTISPECIES: ferrous iron transport protein B [Acinetobacter]MEC8122765.1 ferrous iron transport protein B [Pseudomonadota bacterium]ATZ65376.1 ferrous iron transport protein B [Acinetobacter bereziniae]MBI0395788.1 ferrous iron transport protein B [Acinetobacter bereziniae]MBJ9372251.1 ferrous iron transport protein B [Acinetobacter sp. TGL-Y2]MBJ9901284.1 ferrous iron transport protein B [Acinetobacter bereziniae]